MYGFSTKAKYAEGTSHLGAGVSAVSSCVVMVQVPSYQSGQWTKKDWDHTVKYHPLYGCDSASVAQNTLTMSTAGVLSLGHG